MPEPTPPELPTAALAEGGWEQVEESVETLFEIPGMTVTGATLRYEDERTRAAVHTASDGKLDRPIRFFAATTIGFEPPLPPGITPSMFAPTLRSEVRRQFARRLRDRGLEDVERGRTERLRVGNRNRARLTQFSAVDRFDDTTLPVECWVAVWTDRNDVRVVSGSYPTRQIAEQFDLDTEESILRRSQSDYREDFLSLLRSVQ